MPKGHESPVTRLHRRIAERLDADREKPRAFRKTITGLAKHCGIAKSTLSEQLSGPGARRGLLFHLDKIGEYLDHTPASQLVHRFDTAQMELTSEEFRLVAHWRSWPIDVQHRVMVLFEFFAGLLPEEQEQRRFWFKWRRLKASDRREIEASIDELLHRQRSGAPRIGPGVVVQAPTFDTTGATRVRRRDQKG